MAAPSYSSVMTDSINEVERKWAAMSMSGTNPDGTTFVTQTADRSTANQFTVASAQTARTTGTGAGPSVVFGGNYRHVLLVATFPTIGAAGTSLQLIIQGSADGINWADLGSFDTLVPTDPAAIQMQMRLSAMGGGSSTTKAAPGTIAARTVNNGVFTDRFRVWEVVVGTYTTAPVYTIAGYAQT